MGIPPNRSSTFGHIALAVATAISTTAVAPAASGGQLQLAFRLGHQREGESGDGTTLKPHEKRQ